MQTDGMAWNPFEWSKHVHDITLFLSNEGNGLLINVDECHFGQSQSQVILIN